MRDLPLNTATMRNRGIDFNAAYSLPLFNLGKLSWSFIGTRMLKARVDNGLSQPYDCVGFYGPTCSGGTVAASAPIPKWRHKLRTSWQSNFGLGLSLQWRYVGKVKAETLQDNNTTGGDFNFEPGLSVKAQNYFDLASTFTVGDHYNFRLGVNNILDKNPPLFSSSFGSCAAVFCNGNTYPGVYDVLGRYLYAAATLNF